MNGKLLVVDDEDFNRDIIRQFLKIESFEIVDSEDGQDAWERLSGGERFDAVLLDRMMPRMDGLELLGRMQADPNLRGTPVILQTSASAHAQIAEGINLGAFYYLTKPFDRDILLAVVRAALVTGRQQTKLLAEIATHKGIIHLAQSATYLFSTLEEAQRLAVALSCAAADPNGAGLGLSELLVNAIEHGNLGITYDEKVDLLKNGRYEPEIERRLNLVENQGKRAALEFSRQGDEVVYRIADQGTGFDWAPYMELKPDRTFSPCGRGIVLARTMAFHTLEYKGSGNEVIARTGRRT